MRSFPSLRGACAAAILFVTPIAFVQGAERMFLLAHPDALARAEVRAVFDTIAKAFKGLDLVASRRPS